MKVQELRQLDAKKLNEKLKELVRKLSVFRFHVKTGQEANTAEIGKMRKQIAQIKTLLNNESK